MQVVQIPKQGKIRESVNKATEHRAVLCIHCKSTATQAFCYATGDHPLLHAFLSISTLTRRRPLPSYKGDDVLQSIEGLFLMSILKHTFRQKYEVWQRIFLMPFTAARSNSCIKKRHVWLVLRVRHQVDARHSRLFLSLFILKPVREEKQDLLVLVNTYPLNETEFLGTNCSANRFF